MQENPPRDEGGGVVRAGHPHAAEAVLQLVSRDLASADPETARKEQLRSIRQRVCLQALVGALITGGIFTFVSRPAGGIGLCLVPR